MWAAFSGGEGEDGVAVFAPDGTLIGRILLPERCANLCFGGRKRNRLFMTAMCGPRSPRGEGEDGVAVFAPDRTLIGRILLPERCANLCFGGRKRNRLFMTASQSVYALYVEAIGVAGG